MLEGSLWQELTWPITLANICLSCENHWLTFSIISHSYLSWNGQMPVLCLLAHPSFFPRPTQSLSSWPSASVCPGSSQRFLEYQNRLVTGFCVWTVLTPSQIYSLYLGPLTVFLVLPSCRPVCCWLHLSIKDDWGNCCGPTGFYIFEDNYESSWILFLPSALYPPPPAWAFRKKWKEWWAC